MATTEKKIPSFFKCFNAVDRTEKLYLPESWCSYMRRTLPSKAFLRNRYGSSWEVMVAHYKNTDKFWFEKGWGTFAEQNKLAYNDRIVFTYDGKSTYDFQLFDENDDEKDYLKNPNSKEKQENEQLQDIELEQVVQKPEEQPNMHLEPLDSESGPQLQSEAEPQLEPEPEELDSETMQPDLAPGLTPTESNYSGTDGEDGDDLEEEDTRSRRTVSPNIDPPITEEDEEVIFRSGFSRPNNPYFVTKRRRDREEMMYVPKEVIKDFNLTFREHIAIRDERGFEWEAKVHKWKDGRLWISKGWKAFCKWNNVKRDDWCIVEIVMPQTPGAEIFFKIHLVLATALRATRGS